MSLRKIKSIYFILPPLVLVIASTCLVFVLNWDTQSLSAQILIYTCIILAIIGGLAVIIEIPLLFYLAFRKPKSISSPTQKTLFGKIESKEHAVKIINHVSKVFVILGVIQIIISTLFDATLETRIGMSVVGIIYIVLAFLLRKFKKPIIAVILLLFSLVLVSIDSLNLFGVFGGTQKRNIPIIGIAVAIATIRAIQAALKYNQKQQDL